MDRNLDGGQYPPYNSITVSDWLIVSFIFVHPHHPRSRYRPLKDVSSSQSMPSTDLAILRRLVLRSLELLPASVFAILLRLSLRSLSFHTNNERRNINQHDISKSTIISFPNFLLYLASSPYCTTRIILVADFNTNLRSCSALYRALPTIYTSGNTIDLRTITSK